MMGEGEWRKVHWMGLYVRRKKIKKRGLSDRSQTNNNTMIK